MALVAATSLLIAGCSAPEAPEAEPTPAPEETTPAVAQSAEVTFWDLAPLGDGAHIKVQVEDRAKAADCAGLNALFARIVADDAVEGFTDEALSYIDTHRSAANCDGTESGASPSPTASPSPSIESQW